MLMTKAVVFDWFLTIDYRLHFLEDFMKSVLENICKFKVALIPIN